MLTDVSSFINVRFAGYRCCSPDPAGVHNRPDS